MFCPSNIGQSRFRFSLRAKGSRNSIKLHLAGCVLKNINRKEWFVRRRVPCALDSLLGKNVNVSSLELENKIVIVQMQPILGAPS